MIYLLIPDIDLMASEEESNLKRWLNQQKIFYRVIEK